MTWLRWAFWVLAYRFRRKPAGLLPYRGHAEQTRPFWRPKVYYEESGSWWELTFGIDDGGRIVVSKRAAQLSELLEPGDKPQGGTT